MADNARILLTGAGGQLGSELRERLGGLGTLIAGVRPGDALASTIVNACEVDLAQSDALRRMVREVRPQVIVNAAAYTAVDVAERDVERAEAVNAIAPSVLAEEAARVGAALVHYSTDYVFSGAGERPWTEDDEPAPLNVYGRTKLAGERAIAASGAAHVILRTSWVYGPAGRNFITTMFRLSQTRSDLTVVDDQVGAPTSTRFLAELTAALITRMQAKGASFLGASGGVLHAVCCGHTSWYEFAREIFRLAAELKLPVAAPCLRPINSVLYPTPARRPLNSRLSTARLESLRLVRIPSWQEELAAVLPRVYARFAELADG